MLSVIPCVYAICHIFVDEETNGPARKLGPGRLGSPNG